MNTIGFATGDVNYHVAYGSIALDVPHEQETRMYVGSDDAVKVWLNGNLVYHNPIFRGASNYQESFPITLKKGENILLVAVYEGVGKWSGFFGFTEGTVYTLLPPVSANVADINSDGKVNIQDLVLAAGAFGETGENVADINGDGDVNILDLILIAGAFGEGAAAPATHTPSGLTRETIQQWLTEAGQMKFTDVVSRRGMSVLGRLLTMLTPEETALLANYPNPFNPETWIPYRLSKPADVTVIIYAANGAIVRTLALGHQPVGMYQNRSRAAYWDGKNAQGEPVASGIYFYTLTAGDFTATRKMLIQK